MRSTWFSPLFVAGSLFGGACSEPRRDQPLVVLLLVDTLRRDALSCYGGERATPAMDALAAEGVRFEQAIASSGWTLPSAASLLTGVAPPVHQARGKKARLTPISPDVPTGAERLAAAGVRTLAFTNAAFVNPLLDLTRGFESVSHHHAYNHEIRRADATLDAALAQLAEDDGRPTLCLIHLFDPHLDYDAPREFAQLYAEGLEGPRPALQWKDCSTVLPGQRESVTPEHAARVRAAYDAEIAFVDAQIARLVAELERRGDLARTTIIVTADHGEEFWDHGAFEHGHSLYDELVRVPLILRTPAPETRGQVITSQVRTLDLMPTLFELFGVPSEPGVEGRSLLPLLRGADTEPRPIVLDSTLYGHDKVALRTERHKLILDRNPAAERRLELYDWVADPREQHELSSAEPELAERLRMELEARLAAYAEQAKDLRPGELIDLTPAKQDEILEQLEALGYGGGDDG
jgi:arylsulfatase A-like enzyme